jgi:hypothetical protein
MVRVDVVDADRRVADAPRRVRIADLTSSRSTHQGRRWVYRMACVMIGSSSNETSAF